MDGYIKNVKKQIKTCRQIIFFKCSVSLVFFIFVLIFLLDIVGTQTPEEWESTDIIYSHMDYEHTGRRYLENTVHAADGRVFVIWQTDDTAERLRERLVIGKRYFLVYSSTLMGADIIQSLSDGNGELLPLEASVDSWKERRHEDAESALWVFALGVLSAIVIDRTWCRRDHDAIRKLKEKIKIRRGKNEKRGDKE